MSHETLKVHGHVNICSDLVLLDVSLQPILSVQAWHCDICGQSGQ